MNHLSPVTTSRGPAVCQTRAYVEPGQSPGRTLLYFGHVPLEGAGSAIIVLRHLQRFATEGWRIRVVADWGQDHSVCKAAGWPVLELPHRRAWWPPYDPDKVLGRRLRSWLWARETRMWQRPHDPADAVLTYLSAFSDTLSHVAAAYSRCFSRPLATLIHDDARCFTPASRAAAAHRRRQDVIIRSTRAWFASPELAACYDVPASISGVLPPIPEGCAAAEKPTTILNAPLLVYAGNYWAPQLATLGLISRAARQSGGRLMAVLSKAKAEHIAELQADGVECRPPFPRNTDALDHYRRHAGALVVSYAPDSAGMPWTRTSFPSKLIEYCHLGLPIVIVAAADTAVARWARARSYPDLFAPDDGDGLREYVVRLRNPQFRADRAGLALDLAHGEFSPERIQRTLAESLHSAFV